MSEKQIVALSVDKVQAFLTETIHSHVQEKQTEQATLKSIMNASREISEGFHNVIKRKFPETKVDENENKDKNELLSCSGVYIFKCGLPVEAIEAKLNELFLAYYHSSQGQKLLKCVFFPEGKYDKIEAIQEAKKRLKQSGYLNERIEKNKETLFSFSTVDKKNTGVMGEEAKPMEFPMFARDINALFSKEESANENHFRIAVIKADLDDMGNMFKKINGHKFYRDVSEILNEDLDGMGNMSKKIDGYDVYREVSEILNDEVCLEGLHESIKGESNGRTGWLFPFYVAGDDIFFAVSVKNLIKGIEACGNILSRINRKLEKVSSLHNIPEVLKLSMSIGVEITFNREPIRYYMERVESQLKKAKETNPASLGEFLKTKISICGLTYLDIDYTKLKEYKKNLSCMMHRSSPKCTCTNCKERKEINSDLQDIPIWTFFRRDVKLLNYMRAEGNGYNEILGTPGFFYTLLERLSVKSVRESDMRYINSVLYHLLPRFTKALDKEKRNLELLLNAGILSQLFFKKEKGGVEIALDSNTRHRLETYLRLMLLFSDSRFGITDDADSAAEQKLYTYKDEELDNARKYLFSKSTDYLYKEILIKKDKCLTKVFANEECYQGKVAGRDKTGRGKRSYLQKLKIEKSMFVKLRELAKVSNDEARRKAINMIELRNKDTKQEIQKLNDDRKSIGKAPINLFFDKDKFWALTKENDAWNEDFVDSLMLLYKYKELTIPKKELKKENSK